MTAAAPSLPEKVVAIHRALAGARVGHAFGGAIALAYYAEPRATIDVDVNLFVAPERHGAVAAAVGPLGVDPGPDSSATALIRDGQARWWWDETPVDLFFAYDPIHDAMADAIRRVPFGRAGERIPILAPEHLIACKVAFDRPKDWLDVEQMLFLADGLDPAAAREWIVRVTGPGDPRVRRFDDLAAV